ncbi:MAG: DMT family transporter [Gammaproteobacteria bacterium]
MNHSRSATFSPGALLATLAALCWGGAVVMSKGALDSFPPVFLLVVQLIASVGFLWGYLLLRRAPLPRLAARDLAAVAALGLLEPGLAYLLSLIGLTATEAGSAVLIYASEAVLILALSAVLFGQMPGMRVTLLSLLAFTGLLVALGAADGGGHGGGDGDGGRGRLFGNALIFAGTLVAALYVVLSGRFATRLDAVIIVAWQQIAALGFALLMLPLEWAVAAPGAATFHAPLSTWLLAAASGVVQYALAFWLYIAALARIDANHAGSFLNLIPLFGLAGAFVFLGERMSWLQLCGAVVTVCAVAAINRRGQS